MQSSATAAGFSPGCRSTCEPWLLPAVASVLADRHPGEKPAAVAEDCIRQHGWLWRPYEPAVQFTEPGLFGVARRAELDVLAPEDSPAAVRCYSRAAMEA